MTANLTTRNETLLNDAELDGVTGGAGSPTLFNPLLAAAEKLSAIQPIHLPPLGELHVALPHF
jgi:hypothetical protein